LLFCFKLHSNSASTPTAVTVVAVHGVDSTQAGLRQLWYGEEVRTFTSHTVSGTAHHVFGVEEGKAVLIGELVDAGIGLSGGLGTAAKGPQIAEKFSEVFVLSRTAKLSLAGGGYVEFAFEYADDLGRFLQAGGLFAAGENSYQLYSSIPEEGAGGVNASKGPMTPDQQALKELVDETTLGGRRPLTTDQAETVLDWAEEVGYPGVRAKPGDVENPSNWPGGGGQPHIHVPGVGSGHIPVQPGVRPR